MMRSRRIFAGLLMERDSICGALNTAFCTALLVGSAIKTAEAAVLEGIGACEGILGHDLVIETVRSAIRERPKSIDVSDGELLPSELRCLLTLHPVSRDCFVLRVLAGLPSEVCAGLLDISVTEFENAVCDSLRQLPALSLSKAISSSPG